MMDNGKIIKDMVKEDNNIMKDHYMKVIGKMINFMDMEEWLILMVIIMKEIGIKEYKKDKENS